MGIVLVAWAARQPIEINDAPKFGASNPGMIDSRTSIPDARVLLRFLAGTYLFTVAGKANTERTERWNA